MLSAARATPRRRALSLGNAMAELMFRNRMPGFDDIQTVRI
jgi:hypothetical protein